MNTAHPHQYIAPTSTCERVISKVHGNMPLAGKPLANVYAPSGKLIGTITSEQLLGTRYYIMHSHSCDK